jgi:hypothetical protein
MSEVIDFNAPDENDPGQADTVASVSRVASLNARAVLPNGTELTRSEVLANLGLNPNTSPTAWLAIIGCGVNASALLPGDLERVAVTRVSNASSVLKQVQGVSGSGFSSGGQAP